LPVPIDRVRRTCFAVAPPYSDVNADDSLRHGYGKQKVGRARVRVVYDSGAWVERRRSRAENLYVLSYADGRREEHSGIGQGFYEPVAEITGFYPVNAGSDTVLLGWQGTSDPKLLVGQSPAVVDRQLTRMIGTNVLEEAVSLARADARDLHRDAKAKAAEAAELKGSLETLSGLGAAQEIVQAAEAAVHSAEALEETIAKARDTTTVLKTVRARGGAIRAGLSEAAKPVGDVGRLLVALNSVERQIREGMRLAGRLKALVAFWAAAEGILVAEVKAQSAGSIVAEVETLATRLTTAYNLKEVIDSCSQEIGVLSKRLQEAQVTQSSLRGTIAAELERNPACPQCGRLGICPHCGKPTVLGEIG